MCKRDPILKLPSHKVLTTHGVPRSTAIYIQNNHWTIAPEFKELFKTYYLLRWKAKYFVDTMQEGVIIKDYIHYQVIYYRTDSVAVAKCKGDLLLSFRSLVNSYEAQPTVLITLAGD